MDLIKEKPVENNNMVSLHDVVHSRAGVGREITLHAQVASNIGNTTILAVLPMKTFFSQSFVANASNLDVKGISTDDIAQRALNKPHAKKLALYMLKGIMQQCQDIRAVNNEPPNLIIEDILSVIGGQPYTCLQPIVCNIRNIKPDLTDLRVEKMYSNTRNEYVGCKLFLSQKHMFYVVDGQHRREAMAELYAFLQTMQTTKRYNKKSLLTPYVPTDMREFALAMEEVSDVAHRTTTVQIECHLGLSVVKERQLFHDLNNLGKKVDQALVLEYDLSNPVNELAYIIYNNADYPFLKATFTKKDIQILTSKLLLNKINTHGISKEVVKERIALANSFWGLLNKQLSSYPDKTHMVSNRSILTALATLMFKYNFSKQADDVLAPKLVELISNFDFSITNSLWRLLLEDTTEYTTLKTKLLELYPNFNLFTSKDIVTGVLKDKYSSKLTKYFGVMFKLLLED